MRMTQRVDWAANRGHRRGAPCLDAPRAKADSIQSLEYSTAGGRPARTGITGANVISFVPVHERVDRHRLEHLPGVVPGRRVAGRPDRRRTTIPRSRSRFVARLVQWDRA